MVSQCQTLCPFKILQDYVAIRRSRKTDEKFFVFADRTLVQPHNFRQILAALLQWNCPTAVKVSVQADQQTCMRWGFQWKPLKSLADGNQRLF